MQLKDSISDQTTKAIELLKEIENLKEQLEDYENLKQLLKKAYPNYYLDSGMFIGSIKKEINEIKES